MNRVTGPYSAIVDGKSTALAGCKSVTGCEVAHLCLRADQTLASKALFPKVGGRCQCFIAVEVEE